MTHHTIARIAVIILGIVLICFGLYHFLNPENLVGYVPAFMPGGQIWVYITGAAFILAGIAFIMHKQVNIAGYLLALLLVIFVLTIHLPNYLNSGSPEMRQIAFVNLLKDTALAAFALYLASNARNLEG
jgi:putative oxidoreductase